MNNNKDYYYRTEARDMIESTSFSIEDIIKSDEHIQLVDGKAVIEDKITVTHNIVVNDIATAIRNYIFTNKGSCKVFTENVALYVNELLGDDKNFYLPDVMVICDDAGIKDDGIHCTPLFVAEVTSEATKKYDYFEKLGIYRRIGVEEYWIVDIQKDILYKYLKVEDYIPQVFIHPTSVDVSVYPQLTIKMSIT